MRRVLPQLITATLTALAAAALAVLPAAGQDRPPESPAPAGTDGGELAIERPDISGNPVIRNAAQVQPVPPDAVIALLPDRLGDLPRASAAGRIRWLGPAGMTEVVAVYGSDAAMTEVRILDTAGFPQHGLGILELVPVGERREQAGRVREGVRVAGYPAVSERLVAGGGGRLQIAAGPRLRVTLQKARLADEHELERLAAAFDLAALAALAPAPPPPPPDPGDGDPEK
ncbi:MAG: hypothetical protein Kow0062_10330 [Acidobacteriota bacterium]